MINIKKNHSLNYITLAKHSLDEKFLRRFCFTMWTDNYDFQQGLSDRNTYLVSLWSSVFLSTELDPALMRRDICSEKNLSQQLESRTNDFFPLTNGKSVILSGRLPSFRSRPTGSIWNGSPAASGPLLIAACQGVCGERESHSGCSWAYVAQCRRPWPHTNI